MFVVPFLTITSKNKILQEKAILTDPVIIQFFLGTNLAALTGKSQTSKDFTSNWNKNKTQK